MDTRLRWLALGAVIIASLAALILLSSGLGVRAGVWSFRAGFRILGSAAILGILGAALSAIALVMTRPTGAGAALLAGALIVSAAVFLMPGWQLLQARSLPVIHDITTDTADPPAFVAVLPLRAGAPNPATYGGPAVAAEQAKAYPDIAPLHLGAAPAASFQQALTAARDMGWTVVAADATAGRIEATASTRWFGFHDDIVVRIRPDGTGSRVDVRSVSRVGRSDVGANARRIRGYLSRLAS